MGVSCKVEDLRGESRPVLPLRDQPALFRQREGRCSRYGGALFFSHTDFLGTNTFVLKYFPSFLLFFFDRRRFRLSSSFSSFVFVVVFETLTFSSFYLW